MTLAAVNVWVRRQRDVIIFALLACAVPLGYSLYTKHIWEDFFITFRHSQNLVEGKGLVYNPGERVHGFTSPLGTLLPALAYFVTGNHSYSSALWLFRVMSIAAFCTGGVLVFRRLRDENVNHPYLPYVFAILFAFEAKSVAYTTNGMETGFMLLFLGWGFHLLMRDAPYRVLQMGICWAGLMWTRPDGIVPIAALFAGNLLFFSATRKQTIGALLKSGLVGAAFYAPWVIWAWDYYGSPVPHTITAKGQTATLTSLGEIVNQIYANYPLRAAQAFAPIYYPNIWTTPWWIGRVSYCLGILCSLYWLFPVSDRLGRAASLSFLVLCLYFAFMPFVFPWYLPPATLCGLITLTSCAGVVARAVSAVAWRRHIVTATAASCVAVPVVLFFGLNARLMHVQQKNVEMGNRAQLGLWLREHTKPNETVFLEPLGYIGYFSGARMLDYPGLASPRVVAGIRDKKLNYPTLIQDLKPDWVVLRPWELQETLKITPSFTECYAAASKFDVHAQCEKYASLPGSPYMFCDAVFHIYRRKSEPVAPTETQLTGKSGVLSVANAQSVFRP